MKKGSLYIVATPIGNLSELSPRALEVLNSVSYIAAEDTRVSSNLCRHFNVKTKIISNHQHNENSRSQQILEFLLTGFDIAVICDAGMPMISDPGSKIVSLAIENNINIIPISGPCALINGLVGSGLNSQHFLFYGFLDKNCHQQLESLKDLPYTLIFYQSKYQIENTLKAILEVLGNRKIAIARELTKIHEQFLRGNVEDLILESINLKGEFVLIVEGNSGEDINLKEEAKLLILIQQLKDANVGRKDVIAICQNLFNVSKKKISTIYLNK